MPSTFDSGDVGTGKEMVRCCPGPEWTLIDETGAKVMGGDIDNGLKLLVLLREGPGEMGEALFIPLK